MLPVWKPSSHLFLTIDFINFVLKSLLLGARQGPTGTSHGCRGSSSASGPRAHARVPLACGGDVTAPL